MEPTCSVDGLLAVDLVAREDHHPADGVTDAKELLLLLFGQLVDGGLRFTVRVVGRDDRVTGQEELTQRRQVVEVLTRRGDVQVERGASGQRLTPQCLVVAPQCLAGLVRVAPTGIGSEVEARVDHVAPMSRPKNLPAALQFVSARHPSLAKSGYSQCRCHHE